MTGFQWVDYSKTTRGLAVIINNSNMDESNLSLLCVTLLINQYRVEIINDPRMTINKLRDAIKNLKFPPYVDQKSLQRIKNKYEPRVPINDNRAMIYKAIGTSTTDVSRMINDMNMYGGPLAEKNDRFQQFPPNVENSSLFVIYFGDTFDNESYLFRGEGPYDYDIVSKEYFINLFSLDSIPSTIRRLFTFVSKRKEWEENFSYRGHIGKATAKGSKMNQVIQVGLKEVNNAWIDFIKHFVEIINASGRVGRIKIDKLFDNKNNLISRYEYMLHDGAFSL